MLFWCTQCINYDAKIPLITQIVVHDVNDVALVSHGGLLLNSFTEAAIHVRKQEVSSKL